MSLIDVIITIIIVAVAGVSNSVVLVPVAGLSFDVCMLFVELLLFFLLFLFSLTPFSCSCRYSFIAVLLVAIVAAGGCCLFVSYNSLISDMKFTRLVEYFGLKSKIKVESQIILCTF